MTEMVKSAVLVNSGTETIDTLPNRNYSPEVPFKSNGYFTLYNEC